MEKHITYVVGKAKKAINASWGLMKRIGLEKLSKRMYLLETLARSGCLYGVEIWGLKRREPIEKMQGKFMKMIMGLNNNTPDYIWKLEAGVKSLVLYTRNRAVDYVARILNMEDERWPKICLKEEIRGLGNGEPTIWGSELKKTWEEAGKGEMQLLLKNGINGSVFGEKMKEGLIILNEQDTQQDFIGVEKSRYWEWYKTYKENYHREPYWEEENIKGRWREQWARIRCGNMSKEGRKGFSNEICRICKIESESFNHIWVCSKAREKMRINVVRELEEWKVKSGGADENWGEIIREALKGKPIREICIYAIELEKIIREGKNETK